MRNIFLEKSYTESGGGTTPRPFSEKNFIMSKLLKVGNLKDYSKGSNFVHGGKFLPIFQILIF